MGVTDFLKVARRYWPVIVATVVVALGAAWVTNAVGGDASPPGRSYRATAVLVASVENPTFGVGLGTPSADAVSAFVSLYDVAKRAAKELGYEGDPLDLSAQVGSHADPDTGFVSIEATAPDPVRAEQLSDAFSRAVLQFLVDYRVRAAEPLIQQLETQVKELEQSAPGSPLIDQYSAQLRAIQLGRYDPGYARLEGGPAQLLPDTGFKAPRSFLVQGIIAGLIGLALGLGIAVVLAKMDTTIRTRAVAEEAFELPVLAEIPVIPRGQREAIVSATDPASPAAEAFRVLGTEVSRLPIRNGKGETGPLKEPGALLVTSAGPAEGKTTVTANLAVAFAEIGKRVIVLSCDFRRPEVHRLFGVPNDEGLSDAIRSDNGKPLLSNCTFATPFDRVSLVPSGPPQDTPGALLSSDTMATVFAEAKAVADIVLVDSAPTLAVSDAARLLPHVDGVLVVARAGKTRPDVAARTTEMLQRLDAPLVGVVLNAATETTTTREYRRYVRTDHEEEVRENPTYRVPSQVDNV